MEPQLVSCDQKLPLLSARHQWFIAQNLESHSQILYTLGNQQNYYHCQINELRGRRIRACFHGWVILSDHHDTVLWSLWNPLTSKLIRLPPLIHEAKHSHECCLSAPPDDQGSVLLLTTIEVATIVFCRLDRKRKKLKWTEMSYAKQLKSISGEDVCFLESPTCCNGKVYAMASMYYYHFVIHIDIVVKGKELVISLLPFVELPRVSFRYRPFYNGSIRVRSFLKGSCIELFYIIVSFEDETRTTIGDVHLFTLGMTNMIWEKMVDLKNTIIFLELASDYSACYYSSALDSELGGHIYILGDSGKIIYSFHAKDRTLSVTSMPCSVLESQASAWAMLEWRFEIDHAESKHEEEDTDTQIVVRPAKVDNTNLDGTTGESHLLNIPIHILEMIMELCIGIEYMRFRATCKHCCLAAPPIQWNSITTIKRLQKYSLDSPWLMVLDNDQGIITYIDPICGERYFIKTPQELKGDYQIYCSKYGWLLMFKIQDGSHLAFFNPLTSKILKLPEVPSLDSYCFSAPPTSGDCMVVGFTLFGHVLIHFVSRESIWHLISLNLVGDDPYSFQFPTFNGRDVYTLCNNNKGLNVFRDMAEVDFSWEVVVDEAPSSRCRSLTQYFLSSCHQHLLLVILGKFGESVEVFKLKESTEEWEQTNSLGKHMIYISDASCICLDAKLQEMENKIYFPRLLDNEDTQIVFYSLETCRYHTFNDKNILESFGADFLGTKHHCHPHTWIEPSWS
ncbi:hypothetical protein HanRHA438_Chr01g0038641 [Helianthus annuus]|nr:hypothetical protein HanXRQr2_Chr01g0037721 [Helianthus annuus]KAJ0628103.1 hypothetical protein HanHA89_Chr01g0033081 [Helianthus annuus]KAJ0784391.1 hypothetical protein HanLR1_Chr01g0031581 [Helianthus annuus]KAJ0793610.1 hypothetical protein HanOQP8_Chr01g0031291 [Helianthus annuus]KAJ0949435.1 hypothetical protein HanRHA438_Chr01g0038641 [Helianthus annuus]